MIERVNKILPSVGSELEAVPTTIDLMDLPLGLHPGFIEFCAHIKKCHDLKEQQSVAMDFFNDFLKFAELTQKTKYIQDVGSYEDSIKQLPIRNTLSVVKKHKDLVASRIDQDILLNNKSNQFDVFFKNTLERLYETLKDHHLLIHPTGQDLEYATQDHEVTAKKRQYNFNGTPVTSAELILLLFYRNELNINSRNSKEKSQLYGSKNPGQKLYIDAGKQIEQAKRRCQDPGTTKGTIKNQIERLNYIKPLIGNSVATIKRFTDDLDELRLRFELWPEQPKI
jgi:hypothetical protein